MRLGGRRNCAPPRGGEIRTALPLVNSSEFGLFARVLRQTRRRRIKGGSDIGQGFAACAQICREAGQDTAKPRAKTAKRKPKAAHPVSPLAPKTFAASAAAGRASGSPRAPPASATRTAPTCCWPCWRRKPRSPASSPPRKRPPPPSNGAARWPRRDGPRAGRQQRQRQRLHRQGGHRRRCATWPTWPRPLSAARRRKCSWPRPASSASRCPAERITRILGKLAEAGAADGWRAAAEAIMTTDTFPKLATATARDRRSPR